MYTYVQCSIALESSVCVVGKKGEIQNFNHESSSEGYIYEEDRRRELHFPWSCRICDMLKYVEKRCSILRHT